MIAFLKGKMEVLTPTYVWINCSNVGYEVQISIKTYEQIKDREEVRLYTYLQIREDAHVLYGFFSEVELATFKLLIQISGISGTTARMILSSLTPAEVVNIIHTQNLMFLKKVKGIGAKTGERLLLELKGKIDSIAVMLSSSSDYIGEIVSLSSSETKMRDAIQALQALGIGKSQAEQVCQKISSQIEEQDTVEHIIKLALQQM